MAFVEGSAAAAAAVVDVAPGGGGGSGVAAGKCGELVPPFPPRVSGRCTGTYAGMSKNFCG